MHPDDIRERVTAAAEGDAIGRWRSACTSLALQALEPTDGGWDAGAASADQAIDAGATALLLVDDAAPGVQARAITAIYCGLDASAVVRVQDDDLVRMEWMTAVRDAMPALRGVVTEPLALLASDPRLAWHTAAISHAAVRRTPVVVAGPLPHIAALCAQRVATACVSWVHWGIASDDAAAVASRTRLAREAWLSSTIPLPQDTMQALLRAIVEELTPGGE